jgi:hypothetical protein
MALEMSDSSHPMNAICAQWMQKIKDAKKQKEERFGKYATEAMKFFDGAHDWMWKGEYAKAPGGFLDKEVQGAMPNFRMTVNRVFEAVALFGPVLYHRNPRLMVSPRVPPVITPEAIGLDPSNPQHGQYWQEYLMEQKEESETKRSHASLKEHYLNWLQHETDKKSQVRLAINEAIIKGMSLLWTEMYQPKGSRFRYPKSYYVSVDDLVLDPDAEYWEDIQWIARKVVHPVWQVERIFGLEGKVKGTLESLGSQGATYARGRTKSSGEKRKGKTFDLLEYWQVFSKAGFGDRLTDRDGRDNKNTYDWAQLGDFCYLAISEDIPFPLNLPSESLEKDDFETVFSKVQWPIPYWTDGGWPFSRLHFYDKPKEVWPISLIKPAIGELRFVNWCMSFLADKVAAASTTYVAIAKAAGAEIQDQIKSGLGPYTHIEISEIFGRSVKDVVSFLDAPTFNVEIWNMVRQVLDMIDKRTGLTELVYGLSGPTQMRSATEAEVRSNNVSVRPDEMSSRVEDWLSQCAMKEIEAAEWILSGEEVEPVLGKMGAHIWDNQIRTQDFENTIRDFDYRVEAGTARKPNKVNKVRQLNEFAQIAMPTLQQFAMQGMMEPYNALIEDWAKANDLDASRYKVQPPPPPPQKQGPSPEEIEAQMKQQEMQMEMQLKQMDMQEKQMDMQMKQSESQMRQSDLQSDSVAHQQEVQQDAEKHDQEIKQADEKHQLEMKFMRDKSTEEKK